MSKRFYTHLESQETMGSWPDFGELEGLGPFPSGLGLHSIPSFKCHQHVEINRPALSTTASLPSGCEVSYSLSKDINHRSTLFTEHLLCPRTCAKNPGLRLYRLASFSLSRSGKWREECE